MADSKQSEAETTVQPVVEQDLSVEVANDFSKNKQLKKLKKKTLIIAVVVAVVFILCFFSVLIIWLFKLDTLVFPVKLDGVVTDTNKKELADVQVCVSTKCATTDNSGSFLVSDLQYGKFNVSLSKDGYQKVEEEIELQRGVNHLFKSLQQLGIGDVTGKVVLPADVDASDSEIVLLVDGVTYEVEDIENFVIEKLGIGAHKIEIQATNFKDVEVEITVVDGLNKLTDITLEPAVDFHYQIKDWLSEKSLQDVQVKLNEKVYKSDAIGNLILKDLAPGKDFQISLELNGYNSKQLNVQGVTKTASGVEELTMMRSGKIVYVSNRLGNKNLYASNIDGSGEVLLTGNKGDNDKPFLLLDGKTIGFLSNRDNAKDAYGSTIQLAYTVDVSGNNLKKITAANYSDSGTIGSYNFIAQKRVYNLNNYFGGVSISELYFGPLDGSSSKKILSGNNGYFQNFAVNNKGDLVLYAWNSYDDKSSGLYVLATNAVDPKRIYDSGVNSTYLLDISADSKNALVRVTDESNFNSDLYLVGIASSKVTRLTNTSTTENQARLSPEGDYVYYISTRDQKSDVFKINTTSKVEQRITFEGKVSGYTVQNGLLFFIDDRDLFVTELTDSATKAKKITENISPESFQGFDTYYDWE